MRCFIALELNDAIKDQLQAAQDLFKNIGGRVGWTTRNQMHLTIKFLGETAEELIPEIVDQLQHVADAVHPFEFVVEKLGAFPPRGQPRILWAGIRSCEPLHQLQKLIEEKISPLGFPPEKRDFAPHLTLGRVREPVDTRRCRDLLAQSTNFLAGTQSVNRIVLFSSTLKPSGAEYTPLAEIPLID